MRTQQDDILTKYRIYHMFSMREQSSQFGKYLAEGAVAFAAILLGMLVSDVIFYNSFFTYTLIELAKQQLSYDEMAFDLATLISYCVLGISAVTLGIGAIRQVLGAIQTKKEALAEAILKARHYNLESEYRQYEQRTGKYSPKQWEKLRKYYFGKLSKWAIIEDVASKILSDIITTVRKPYDLLHGKVYHRPSLDELVNMLNLKEFVLEWEKAHEKHTRIVVALDRQFNSRERYLEGFFFDENPGEKLVFAKVQEFLGLEIIVCKLDDGLLIGSIGPNRPSTKGHMQEDEKVTKLKTKLKYQVLKQIYVNLDYDNTLRIGLVTEGTYPFERGGVATVVDDFMRGMKPSYLGVDDLVFDVVSFIGNPHQLSSKIAYPFPPCVKLHQPIVMYGNYDNPELDKKEAMPAAGEQTARLVLGRKDVNKVERERQIKQILYRLEESIQNSDFTEFYAVTDDIERYFTLSELLTSPIAVEALHDIYLNIDDPDKPDYLTYYYNWLGIRQPLIRVIKSTKVPSHIYYCVVTGIGAVYVALAKHKYNAAIVLTEHGIYYEDRLVDLANSPLSPFFTRMWTRTLDFYSRMAYDSADYVTTTCYPNRVKQMRDGAAPEKCLLIPGSLDTNVSLEGLLPPSIMDPDQFLVGLLGNVQPVKRVELFVEVVEKLYKAYPDIGWHFFVMGRDDTRNPIYVARIHSLVKRKGLSDIIQFSPYTDYVKAFAKLDMGLLTSASEVQSRSVMEFLSLAKPMVAPNCGGNQELLYGTDYDGTPVIDMLGKAGIVVDIGAPSDMVARIADAILALYYLKRVSLGKQDSIPASILTIVNELLSQPLTVGEVGKRRMRNYCDRTIVLPQYAEAFNRALMKAYHNEPIWKVASD